MAKAHFFLNWRSAFAQVLQSVFNMFSFVLLLTLLVPGFAASAEEMVLGSGVSREIPISSTSLVSISDGNILKAADLGPRVRITGKKHGQATVKVGSREMTVFVLTPKSFQTYQKLEMQIKKMRGLTLRPLGNSVQVSGRLLRFSDWLKLKESANSEFIFAADLDDEMTGEASQYFKKLLLDSNLPSAMMKFSPEALISLAPEQEELGARYKRVFGPYGFTVEKNMSVLNTEPSIRVRVDITEIRKSVLTKIGIQWPNVYTAQVLPTPIAPGGSGSPLQVQLHALEQKGLARVLASPTLLCRSGKEAQFLAGGEFPIKVVNFKAHDVIWKRYGVLLKFRPKADFSGRMSIGIETEISAIDPSQTVDGLPGLLTNRIESHFDLNKSKTITLSGLLKKEFSEALQGLPGLSRIPILGALFSSNDFREQQTELVVFVTPEIVKEEE